MVPPYRLSKRKRRDTHPYFMPPVPFLYDAASLQERKGKVEFFRHCLLYTSDAADE